MLDENDLQLADRSVEHHAEELVAVDPTSRNTDGMRTWALEEPKQTRSMSPIRARIASVAACLPDHEITSREVESRIKAESGGILVPRGIIQAMSGVKTRRIADSGTCSSDLAASAGREAILRAGLSTSDIDLLIFAAASSDLIEPATANIVQEKIGTTAPVFDLKNACNSFLNGLEVAEAMIQTGRYRNVLVAAGEMPSQGANYNVRNRKHFKACFLGYTLGDAGAAAVVAATDDDRGIFYRAFQTVSQHWEIATFPGGGSMHRNDPEYAYFRGDGQRLRQAFIDVGPSLLLEALHRTGTTFDDYSRIFVHQASMASLKAFCEISGVPQKKVVAVLPRFGNMAAASLPVAFAHSEEVSPLRPGEMTMWLGLAAGLSLGVMLIRF